MWYTSLRNQLRGLHSVYHIFEFAGLYSVYHIFEFISSWTETKLLSWFSFVSPLYKIRQFLRNIIYSKGRHGSDRMVVTGFTTTYAISAYHN